MLSGLIYSDEMKVFSSLVENFLVYDEKTNEFFVESSQRKTAERLNISLVKVNKIMKALVENGALNKSEFRGMYIVSREFLELYENLKEVISQYGEEEKPTNTNQKEG